MNPLIFSSLGRGVNKHSRDFAHHRRDRFCHRSWVFEAEGVQSSDPSRIPPRFGHQQSQCTAESWQSRENEAWKMLSTLYRESLQN